jgi:hypothetical protein
VRDFLLNEEKTGPLRPALFNVMVGAYSVGEMVAKVAEAGFEGARHEAMPEEEGQGLVLAVNPET